MVRISPIIIGIKKFVSFQFSEFSQTERLVWLNFFNPECDCPQSQRRSHAEIVVDGLINFVVRADIFKHRPVLRQKIKNNTQIISDRKAPQFRQLA